MHLHHFIHAHMDEIMAEWVAFARTLETAAEDMTLMQLRDHAEAILRSIALDIDSEQSSQQQYDKSRGNAENGSAPTSAASIHGTQRHQSQFTLLNLSAEFRALRATVLRLWLPRVGAMSAQAARQMIRFNEAIDQALAESIVTYSARSNETRELFLAILGHDLRAPLATVTLAGELLARPTLPAAEVQKIGGRVRRSALVMSRLVDDLIGYTRTELGSGMPFAPVPLDLQAVCQAAVDDAQSTHPGTRFELAGTGPLHGVFDGTRLHQLFTNLLVNAAKYGAATEPVRVHMTGQADGVQVDVNNRGPVIPESEWGSIFQPLVRLSTSVDEDRAQEETSLGLGLYVAREIAGLHGGSIEVVSTAEAGTTFSVWLAQAPVGRSEPAQRNG